MLILIFNIGLIKKIIYPYIGYWGNHKNTFIFTFKLYMYYPYRNGLSISRAVLNNTSSKTGDLLTFAIG